ncbi:sugar transporter SWEET1 [Scyliorhinus torazame]|uniref:sugar transporter SWEET1 n=1 Tax=Scyliorhinus torazame TaxID=75743 RepID=UPI003B58BA51
MAKVTFAGAILTTTYLYFSILISDPVYRLNQLGLICSAFTISMYLSPLADLAKIIRTRSTKCLSFSLTVATILTSTSWTLYGLQMSDYYIVIPNVPGILTSLVRFCLFWSYSSGQDNYMYRPVQA